MDLFDVIVERHKINKKYFDNNILEGESRDYINELKDLRKKAGDKIFDKACLSNGIKSRISLTVKTPKESKTFDITSLIMDSFTMPHESFDERLESIVEDYRDGILVDIDAYAELIDEIASYKNDDWFFDNKDLSKEEIENNYYRKMIVKLIESRFDFDRCNTNEDIVLQYEDIEGTIPTLDTIDGLIELFNIESSTLKRKKDKDDEDNEYKFNLINELKDNGIFKSVFYNYKNCKDIEFSRKFYYNIATFLGIAGSYTEDFLKLHGLSFWNSKMYDAEIYKTVFSCGLNYEYLKYMLDIQKIRREKAKIEEQKNVKPRTSIDEEKSRRIKFKRTFNYKLDYYNKRNNYKDLPDNELDEFIELLRNMVDILDIFVNTQEPKDKKRLATNMIYENRLYYNKGKNGRDKSVRSVNYDIYEKRIKRNKQLTQHRLSDILNESVNTDKKWKREMTIGDIKDEKDKISKLIDEVSYYKATRNLEEVEVIPYESE